ncbi:hypothetical protein J6590_037025 [Homalodisca vitripennis]|nr:hypothetical protein J6590_037025 [Homalodisca vitripennis]
MVCNYQLVEIVLSITSRAQQLSRNWRPASRFGPLVREMVCNYQLVEIVLSITSRAQQLSRNWRPASRFGPLVREMVCNYQLVEIVLSITSRAQQLSRNWRPASRFGPLVRERVKHVFSDVARRGYRDPCRVGAGQILVLLFLMTRRGVEERADIDVHVSIPLSSVLGVMCDFVCGWAAR